MEMLRAGGNAVDAAVAAAWALSVCEPSGSGLGGQTTILIRFPDGGTAVLDGHSRAPAAVSRKIVSREAQRRGYQACTIPSTPATLDAALEAHGRLPRTLVMAPAVALAEDGFPATRLLRRHVQWCQAALGSTEATASVFLPDGRPPRRGAVIRQPELARTLRRLSEHGSREFYEGAIARSIVEDMRRHGGLISAEDLRDLGPPVARGTVSISFHGYEVASVPPPGGGLQLLLGLKILEKLDLPRNPELPLWYGAIAGVVRAAFLERERWPVHPDEIPLSLMRWFLSDERASEIACAIRSEKDRSGPARAEGPGDTTHLCVADSSGTIVSLTQSIQSLFGAKVMNPELGFFYNNYLCTCPRHRHPSRLDGGAAPQSNVAPTLVSRTTAGGFREPVLALGAAGSRRITSSILQIVANVLHRGMSVQEAIDAPRAHATTSGRLMLERRAATPEILDPLSRRFDPIEIKASRSYAMGGAQAIGRDDSGRWVGVADPRREGTANAI
jgi:gamma-glutamyltranspeptidase/glutathione hydrolase